MTELRMPEATALALLDEINVQVTFYYICVQTCILILLHPTINLSTYYFTICVLILHSAGPP